MAYQKFTAFGAGGRDRCTLRASGYLFIPRGLWLPTGTESPPRVMLYFDRDEQKLAVMPYEELFEEEAESRETSVEPSGVAVNIVPLLRVYGILKPQKKVMLDANVIDLEGRKAIEVDLSTVPSAEDPPEPTVSRW